DEIANFSRQRSRRAWITGHIEIGFIERKCFDQRREATHDFANYSGFPAINIKPCWQDDQVWTTLQGHESRHGRTNTEGSRFVITSGEDATPIARPAHADGFPSQGG